MCNQAQASMRADELTGIIRRQHRKRSRNKHLKPKEKLFIGSSWRGWFVSDYFVFFYSVCYCAPLVFSRPNASGAFSHC